MSISCSVPTAVVSANAKLVNISLISRLHFFWGIDLSETRGETNGVRRRQQTSSGLSMIMYIYILYNPFKVHINPKDGEVIYNIIITIPLLKKESLKKSTSELC